MIGQGNRTVWCVFIDGFICVHLGLSSRQGSLTVNLISVSKVCLGLCGGVCMQPVWCIHRVHLNPLNGGMNLILRPPPPSLTMNLKLFRV